MSEEQTRQGFSADHDAAKDGQVRHRILEGYDAGEQPLQSYTVLAGVFNLIFAVFLLLAKGTGRGLPERIETRDIVLLGVATHKLSTLIANDAVTSFLRAPFTELQEKDSPKSVEEKPRGSGFQRSIGELVTCKFCMGQWIASFFTYGLVFVPTVTRLVATVFAIVTVSDHLHQIYKALSNRA
ncbi:DUF1360 domain-containing protein [Rubrobacter indicoceani]|uniref:DUF1360 domain-containing protein n=1 Tax=Rubrobacter indicoceani TaxID=2051957 RepID=UPI0013C4FD73|nr:DUF1360 domain-containing protein [Rubrobacter indicoceani]